MVSESGGSCGERTGRCPGRLVVCAGQAGGQWRVCPVAVGGGSSESWSGRALITSRLVVPSQFGLGTLPKLEIPACRAPLLFPEEFSQPGHHLARGFRTGGCGLAVVRAVVPGVHFRSHSTVGARISPPAMSILSKYLPRRCQEDGSVGIMATGREEYRHTGYGLVGGVSQPQSIAWRTMSTRLRSPIFSIERVLKVSTVLTLRSSWEAISLLA